MCQAKQSKYLDFGSKVPGYSPSKVDFVGLPNVLALALHQVNYLSWMDQGDHSLYQTILFIKVRVD